MAFVTHSDGVALAAATPVVARMEGATFEVVEEAVEHAAKTDGLVGDAARSLKSKVNDARAATLAGNYGAALDLLFAYQGEVVALFSDGRISLDSAIPPFRAAGPIIAALAEPAFVDGM